ncbi:hypothetical protein HZC34_06265 [Candidatus Saganbacteria bacterium]|nr:hypothetical protein [Candidatus Saganbacteria bacterium]
MKKLILFLALCSAFCFLLSAVLFADVPRTINIQGRLTQKDGAPIKDGHYDFTFFLVDENNNFMSTILNGINPIVNNTNKQTLTIDKNGIFNAILEFDPTFSFDPAVYQIKKIVLVSNVIIDPGQPKGVGFAQDITAVPYAINAANADKIGGKTFDEALKASGVSVGGGGVVNEKFDHLYVGDQNKNHITMVPQGNSLAIYAKGNYVGINAVGYSFGGTFEADPVKGVGVSGAGGIGVQGIGATYAGGIFYGPNIGVFGALSSGPQNGNNYGVLGVTSIAAGKYLPGTINSYGVAGVSDTGTGVFGKSDQWIAIDAKTNSTKVEVAAVHGEASNFKVFGELGVSRYFAGVNPPMGVFGTSTDIGVYGSVGDSTKVTTLSTKNIPSIGVAGWSPDGRGVSGGSSSGTGVFGVSQDGLGGKFESKSSDGIHASGIYGVYGLSTSKDGIGIYGANVNGIGVRGWSSTSIGGKFESVNDAGISGYSMKSNGVHGISDQSYGVYGISKSDLTAGVRAQNQNGGPALFVDGPIQMPAGNASVTSGSPTATINKAVGRVNISGTSQFDVTVNNSYVHKDSIILLTIINSNSNYDQAVTIKNQVNGAFTVGFRSITQGFNFLVIN